MRDGAWTIARTLEVLAMLCLAGGVTVASAEPTPSAELPTKGDSQRARIVCKHEIPTGSRIRVTTCRERDQMAETDAQSQKFLKDVQGQSVMGPTPAIRDSVNQ